MQTDSRNNPDKKKRLVSAIAILSIFMCMCASDISVNSDLDDGPYPSWLNVQTHFGAVGNGVADDTAALQAAINSVGTASPIGDTYRRPHVLYLPAGVYRITATLSMLTRVGATIRGVRNATIIQWDGPLDGTMFLANGVRYSSWRNIIWDGRGKAAIGIDQSWDAQRDFSDTLNVYEDLTFQNFRSICLRGGHAGYQDDGSTVRRSTFINCGEAGISIENYNALDWWIEDSKFINNRYGVTNHLGAGTFYIRRSIFSGNTEADIFHLNSYGMTVRDSISQGSHMFYRGGGPTGATRMVTLQNNIVEDVGDLQGRAVWVQDSGPYSLIDNVFNTGDTVQPAVVVAGLQPADVFSIGNTYTSSSPIAVNGRKTQIGDAIVPAHTLPTHSLPDVPPPPPAPSGHTFEVADYGHDANAFQAAIDAAVAAGTQSIVHVAAGYYDINTTLVIPAGTGLTLVGDGEETFLRWTGATGGTILRIEGPTGATVKDIAFNAHDNAIAIEQTHCDQPGSRVIIDRLGTRHFTDYGVLIKECNRTQVDIAHSHWLYGNVGVAAHPSSAPHDGKVSILSSQIGGNNYDFEVTNGGRLLIQDTYMEHSSHFLHVMGNAVTPGEVAIQGAVIKIDKGSDNDAIRVDNFPGKITIMQSNVLYIDPPSEHFFAQIIKTGHSPTKMLSIGNLYQHDPPFSVTPETDIIQLNDRLWNDSVADYTAMPNQWSGDPQVVYDHLQILRTPLPAGGTTPRDLTGVTHTRYENVILDHCLTCLELIGYTPTYLPLVANESVR